MMFVCPNLGHNSLFRDHHALMGGGGGGFFRFQLTEMTEKILRASKRTQKKSLYHDLIPQNNLESAHCFEYPRKSLLKSTYSQKYLLKLLSQTFKPEKSFYHSCGLKSGVPLKGATYTIYQVTLHHLSSKVQPL